MDPTEARAEATHAEIAKSATVLKKSAAVQVSAADRNTELAVDRTVLAAERTYAAWVRTGLASLAAGIGAKALLHDVVAPWLASVASVTLVLFASFCFVAAVWRELFPRHIRPKAEYRRLSPGLLIAVNGVLVIVSLAAAVGVITAR